MKYFPVYAIRSNMIYLLLSVIWFFFLIYATSSQTPWKCFVVTFWPWKNVTDLCGCKTMSSYHKSTLLCLALHTGFGYLRLRTDLAPIRHHASTFKPMELSCVGLTPYWPRETWIIEANRCQVIIWSLSANGLHETYFSGIFIKI